MVLVTTRPPRVLATNTGKVIELRDANPCKEGYDPGKNDFLATLFISAQERRAAPPWGT